MHEMRCEECGAPLVGVVTCREYLNEMVKWDFEDFTGAGQVHHLTVLSYYLQHPSLYSEKGLENAKSSLKEFLRNPEGFKEHDAHNRRNLASSVRKWKISSTPESIGSYANIPRWTILASDVMLGGKTGYIENVKRWSQSVFESLMKSGNLA